MTGNTSVKLSDLLGAFLWVCGNAPIEHEAYVSRRTGEIYWRGVAEFGGEEDVPEDIEDPDLYVAVPHKSDLDLGQDLVFRFAETHMPESFDLVYDFFRKRRAYARFKDLLVRKGQLEHWRDYENKATEQALRDWCEENDLEVSDT